VQSAILASLPKAPSKYDPYTNRNQLVGNLVMSAANSSEAGEKEAEGQLYGKIELELQKAKLTGKDDELEILRYIS
jgi:membrane peptidoglycan carboxypeptidase